MHLTLKQVGLKRGIKIRCLYRDDHYLFLYVICMEIICHSDTQYTEK